MLVTGTAGFLSNHDDIYCIVDKVCKLDIDQQLAKKIVVISI